LCIISLIQNPAYDKIIGSPVFLDLLLLEEPKKTYYTKYHSRVAVTSYDLQCTDIVRWAFKRHLACKTYIFKGRPANHPKPGKYDCGRDKRISLFDRAAAIARAKETKKKRPNSPQQSLLSNIGRDLDRYVTDCLVLQLFVLVLERLFVVTSAKEGMFHLAFVCLYVCLLAG